MPDTTLQSASAPDHPDEIRRALITGPGFTRLEGLLTTAAATEIRSMLLGQLEDARENEAGVLHIPDLILRGAAFEALVTHPRLLAVAHALLGQDAALGAFSGRILMPGCTTGGLHIDYPYWAMPAGMPVDPPLMMQVIWMMEPFSSTNGGTWVAPGSQRWPERPAADRFAQDAIQITGNAGDALVSHGLLWHQTAQNHASEPRVAVLINYTQLTIKPMVPMGPFDDGFKQRAAPALRALLGLDHGAALRNRLKNL
ncbi:MAG: phytanoyl-CoA dioxygenase family protein [bacterium]